MSPEETCLDLDTLTEKYDLQMEINMERVFRRP